MLAALVALSLSAGVTVVSRRQVDGESDDLLTAGLGAEGLRGPVPAFADPEKPTSAELRRRAIYQNYRGLIEVGADGGFGTRYGPVAGQRVAGIEILAGIGTAARGTVTSVLLQIPHAFNVADACLIVAASSGSRGIYGALPTAAEWGLRNGCAVVHVDKGTGTGLFDVDRGAAISLNGFVTTDLATPLTFAPPAPALLERLRAMAPYTLLLKHANSGANPEADWGRDVLNAARAGFELLNEELGARLPAPLTPGNTRVIAVAISNGGSAVLRALELDRDRLIDAAVVSEPNINVSSRLREFVVREGGQSVRVQPRALFDYATLHALLQPCALLAETDLTAPLARLMPAARARNEQWCGQLARAAMVSGRDARAQSTDARTRLIAAGIRAETLRLGALSVQLDLWQSIAAAYASAYARAPIDAMPCGFSFAAVDAAGYPRALTTAELAAAFSDGSGLAPTAGAVLVRDAGDGARSVAAAQTFESALCLRQQHERLRQAISTTESTALPGDRPVIVLHGRGDGLIPVNHSSRAYYMLHHRLRGERDELRYYEIAGGQHFDAFLPQPGMRGYYVAMQPLLNDAVGLVAARLARGTPLPPSQLVREQIRAAPGSDAILIRSGALLVPE